MNCSRDLKLNFYCMPLQGLLACFGAPWLKHCSSVPVKSSTKLTFCSIGFNVSNSYSGRFPHFFRWFLPDFFCLPFLSGHLLRVLCGSWAGSFEPFAGIYREPPQYFPSTSQSPSLVRNIRLHWRHLVWFLNNGFDDPCSGRDADMQ
jgi:hypothetical protein